MIRRPALLLVMIFIGWWLFADTARHLWGPTFTTKPELRFAHYGSWQDYEMWRAVISAFERSHPGTTIRQEYTPGFGTEYENKMRRAFSAGIGPDVLLVQDETLPRYAQTTLADLSTLLSHDRQNELRLTSRPTAVDSFTIGDRLFALPVYGGNLLIYLNLRCLTRAADFYHEPIVLPSEDWTIEEFRNFCRKLTCDFDHDGRVDQFGFWHPWWGYFLPFVWSMGADLLDNSRTQWRFDDNAAISAMQLYHDLLRTDRVCPPPGALGQMRQDIAFLTGRTATVINGPWFIPLLEESDLRNEYLVLPIPRGPAGRFTRVTWDGIAMSKNLNLNLRSAASDFIGFTQSKPAQEIFAASRRLIPSRTDVPMFQSPQDVRRGLTRFITSFEYARLQPINPYWNEINQAFRKYQYDLLNDRISPREFLNRISRDPLIAGHFAVGAQTR